MKRFVQCLALLVLPALVQAGGTVSDSRFVTLTRSGKPVPAECPAATPGCVKLECPVPTTLTECDTCKDKMIASEILKRTSGYVTYRCVETLQSYVKFNRTAPVPPVIPPVEPPPAAIQVLTCPLPDADGRVLENVPAGTPVWPNCPTAIFKNPVKTLVVAVNTGTQPLYWRLASKLVNDERIWIKDTITGAQLWARVNSLTWGTTGPGTPPPATGKATVSWRPSVWNTDGSPLTDLGGYSVLYGQSPFSLTNLVNVEANILNVTIENLGPGSWYFGVKAYNTAGRTSELSDIATKTIF